MYPQTTQIEESSSCLHLSTPKHYYAEMSLLHYSPVSTTWAVGSEEESMHGFHPAAAGPENDRPIVDCITMLYLIPSWLATSHSTLLASTGLNNPMIILMSVLFHSSKTAWRSIDSLPKNAILTPKSLASLTKFSADWKKLCLLS